MAVICISTARWTMWNDTGHGTLGFLNAQHTSLYMPAGYSSAPVATGTGNFWLAFLLGSVLVVIKWPLFEKSGAKTFVKLGLRRSSGTGPK